MTDITDELLRVHDTLARRENMSSVYIAQNAMAEKPLLDAIAAAILTLGGRHGPIVMTQELLEEPDIRSVVQDRLDQGLLVPGWGSGFVKGGPDRVFDDLDEMLHTDHQSMWKKMAEATRLMHDKDKWVWPNAACYTAAVAVVTSVPSDISPSLFLRGRLDAWVEIYANNYNPRL
jgi:citrate synthase